MRLTLFSILWLICAKLVAQVTLTTSNLPIVIINTNGQGIVDEPKITADLGIIYNGPGKENKISDPKNIYNGKIGIELRGSTSQSFPKKPYGFETRNSFGEDLDVSLLGMPKESDWTLNATYNDKSLMRDGLAYMLAGSFMEYAPRVRYCELVLNNNYQGLYMLIEKIKRDKNRVDIAKIEKTDNTGDKLTGGYIIKIDKTTGSNSGDGWNSTFKPYPGATQNTYFQYEYPKAEDISSEQKLYIRNYINDAENAISGSDFKNPDKGFRKYIDTTSLMDYIIINELTKNPDAYRLSTFFYKERDSEGGKIKFGPAWDYNLGFGNVDFCIKGNPEGLVLLNYNLVCPQDGWVIHYWWKRFLEDEVFYQHLKKRYNTLREAQLSDSRISLMIDSVTTLIGDAQARNFVKWPVLGKYIWPNYYIGNTHADEVKWLKEWVTNRLIYLDKIWNQNMVNPNGESETPIQVYPNPVSNVLNLTIPDTISADASYYLTNYLGRPVQITNFVRDGQNIELNVSQLTSGSYIFYVKDGKNLIATKFVKQ